MVNIQTYLVNPLPKSKGHLPTRKQTINYTLLVVGLSIGVAIFWRFRLYFSLGLEQLIK